MFKPTQNRLDYSKKLEPPIGYETIYAIGTTYSLDLDTLLGASIALGLSDSVDNELSKDPLYVLEALRKTSDKVLVFCEGGQIKAPDKSNALYALLEKMVFQVNLKNRGSFHPKFWFVKYEDDDQHVIYRLMILSRNLTFDRSWDFAVTLDGYYSEEVQTKNKALSDFLIFLRESVKKATGNEENRKLLRDIAKELEHVAFSIDKKFKDYSFHPIGIPNYSISNTGLFDSYHELFVISPFLSKTTVDQLKDQGLIRPDRTLITRRDELSSLKPEHLKTYAVYAMKEIIIDGEDAISEGNDDDVERDLYQKQDIHAKLYLKTKGANTDLFIGSLNASNQACVKNVEFLLKLKTKRGQLKVEDLKNDIFGKEEKENPFERIMTLPEPQEEKDEKENLEKSIKDLVYLKTTGECIKEDEQYLIKLVFKDFKDTDKKIFIRPLLGNREEPLKDEVLFEGLKINHLSMFFVVIIYGETETLKRVVKIHLDGIPEERDRAIVNRIIDNKERFLQYIIFMLGEDYFLSFLENKTFNTNQLIFGMNKSVPAIYEKMLKTAATDPKKLDDIQRLMDMISDEKIIPNEFRELYGACLKAVGKK